MPCCSVNLARFFNWTMDRITPKILFSRSMWFEGCHWVNSKYLIVKLFKFLHNYGAYYQHIIFIISSFVCAQAGQVLIELGIAEIKYSPRNSAVWFGLYLLTPCPDQAGIAPSPYTR